MRILSYIAAVLILITTAHAEVKEENMLFYAPYSGSADAAVSLGSPKAAVTPAASFVAKDGRYGLVVEKKTAVTYETAGNLNQNEGTVMFWFKPNWDSGDGKSHTFFQTSGKGMRLRVTKGYTDTQGNNFLYILYDPGYFNAKVDDDTAKFFQKDQWVHIAATWSVSGKSLNIYVNGTLKVTSNLEGERPQPEGRFWVGSSDDYGSFAEGVIADFRIYERALANDEIMGKYTSYVTVKSQ